ncbi:MAG: VIT1/CCC1 transporter family protein [Acidobacteriota bacterium]
MRSIDPEKLAADHLPEAVVRRLQREPKGQNISDAVLGGIDGCITTFAVVSGSVGAGFPASVAVILGFSNLFADGFSMAVSNYESSKAEAEYFQSVKASEEEHIDRVPQGEREEVRQIYRAKGFSGQLLEDVVDTLTADRERWLDVMLTEEHGLSTTSRKPWVSGGVTFVAFLAAGAVPLIPYLFSSMGRTEQFTVSAVLAGVIFFVIGMLKSMALRKPVFWSGVSTLLTGGAAAALSYFTAHFLRNVLNIAAG